MINKSRFSFALIITLTLLLGSCSPARSLNVTVTSQVTVTSSTAMPTETPAPATSTPAPTEIPASPTPDALANVLTMDAIKELAADPSKLVYVESTQDDIAAKIRLMTTGESRISSNGAPIDTMVATYPDGSVNLTCNAMVWRDMAPWFAIEFEGIKAIMYEINMGVVDGVVQRGVLIATQQDSLPIREGEWMTYTTFLQEFSGSGYQVNFNLWLVMPGSSSPMLNPIMPGTIVDVLGQPRNPDKEGLQKTGVFDAKTNNEIFAISKQ